MRSTFVLAGAVPFAVALGAGPQAAAQGVTERASVSTSGTEGNSTSGDPWLSADGTLVVFYSIASNLVTGDKNQHADVFLRDRRAGTTEMISLDTNGKPGNGYSFGGPLSDDGNFVSFMSAADDLVAGDTNHKDDVFLRDRAAGTTEVISVDSSGQFVDGWSNNPMVTPDAGLVAFMSDAAALVAGDTNGVKDVFVRDRVHGTTERISVDSAGVEANGPSFTLDGADGFSADGRFVCFMSLATNLVANDTNGYGDVFVHDRQNGTTERVSVDSSGAEANLDCTQAALSRDGRLVAFRSRASNLVPGDANGEDDIFLHDRATGSTDRVSVDSAGTEGNDQSGQPSFTADGRFVVFFSNADNLVPGDTNGLVDVFVRDLQLSTTDLFRVDWIQGRGEGGVLPFSISADGEVVAFYSSIDDLVENDTNHYKDVFVCERFDASWTNYGAGFPGTHGVPSFTCNADPVLGTTVTLDLANSYGQPTAGLLFAGFQRASLGTNRGGDLLVAPAFTVPITFSYGGDSFDFDVPSDVVLLGLMLELQGIEADPGAAKGVSFSAGLELVLGL